ncbi:putative mitochondrial Lysyl-tRNA synthetase [Leptomonas pyrrhocoris]|uniref:Lysine--tRNA ligase n=1 Tax=Leptomonas pyrrhocoris TaxID=157538 RepID=A0A0N0VGC0_LEPPY|nr:putative mitochondrial Lysyl-tRNA synthetase [Leptomonas pyrrhocoris]KPA82974.1 putative mitochondrial Lysyl-tRNA synthetase [Leptomonas pyrrhocoris]|eukprot:XP_015661413.1 putative mitochondrial Lysyl-tRNA synthetase [Leptomonas pyrrhocoris]
MHRRTQARVATVGLLLLSSLSRQSRWTSSQASPLRGHADSNASTYAGTAAPPTTSFPSPPPPPSSSSSLPAAHSEAVDESSSATQTTVEAKPKEQKASRRKNKKRRTTVDVSSGVSPSPDLLKGSASQTSSASPALSGSNGSNGQAALPNARTILDFPSAYQSFSSVMPLGEFRATYDGIPHNESHPHDHDVRVGGRVVSTRDMGRILFITIRSGEVSLQVIRQVSEHFTKADLRALSDSIRVGDIIGATGTPGRTAKGELSLFASATSILAPYVCTDQALCPDLKGYVPLSDTDIKYRYRFVDMMSNPSVVQHFRKRHAVTRALRDYLDRRGFVEVETPVLHSVASGANAKPFMTHHNANDTDLFLRVAPELHLKQCVVGGMDRVYEIGRVFRNEDADRSHNPEFTTCEFYAAYHTYEDLMRMTEEIMRQLAVAANGTTKVSVTSCLTGEQTEIDLTQPFRRVSAYDEVQRAACVELPPPTELNTARGMAYMSAIMLRYNIPLPSVRTAAKMFDKLIDYFITDRVVAPTFVTDHPLFMSPLALERRDRPGLSARFELFINGMEYCNAYSELNDPQEQYYRFQQQLLDKQTGDEEAMGLDETFLKALQVGLPPTAGWGMGMDRVVMLLNGSSSIRDDILFPLLRTDTTSHDAKRRRKTASFFGFSHNMTLFCLNALEEEMLKRAAPQDSLEKIRQLRQCITSMPQRGGLTYLPEDCVPRGWRYDVTMGILRLFCCRGKY